MSLGEPWSHCQPPKQSFNILSSFDWGLATPTTMTCLLTGPFWAKNGAFLGPATLLTGPFCCQKRPWRGEASLPPIGYTSPLETTKTVAYDKLTVQVLNSSGAVLATYSNLNAASGYVLKSFSLAPYIGQTVTIKFTGSEDSSLATSFVLDDVTLTVQ